MVVVAVINQKGGVGKTTTTVNLGAGLARLGKRVLLVDLDPQANLTSHLEPARPEGAPGAYELLKGEASLAEAAHPTGTPGLFVVPGDEALAGCDVELANEIGRETLLRDRLREAEGAADGWDVILLDCPPSLGLLSINALAAADEALVPIQAEFFALSGMARFVQVQDVVRRRLNPRLRLGGIVICMWRGSARLSHEVREEVAKVFGEALYRTVVRQNVKLAEAPSAARTIFEHAPEAHGARDYAAIAVEFLERHGERPAADALDRLLEGAAAAAAGVHGTAQKVPVQEAAEDAAPPGRGGREDDVPRTEVSDAPGPAGEREGGVEPSGENAGRAPDERVGIGRKNEPLEADIGGTEADPDEAVGS